MRHTQCRSPTLCVMAPWTASLRRSPPPSLMITHTRNNTHSAIFAEVKVDEQLGVIRVTRVVSAVAGGRILNTKTAHSQIMGSVVGESAWHCTKRRLSTTTSAAS